ncbi:hypothetical protein GGS23DRAFT_163364 [Durotheca rogersii]|uniref:uncharacterized protein n=1 Tax=Durotheca rogersii TaxID=419775 RepID=UPI0022202788|nr:uncharacterized protein GGS23DRAFT_163364 [Durotheca rogersii]KAI5867148.1 hypothetical protein GGS23DRAFT_163364 [Durotheca rogersii]
MCVCVYGGVSLLADQPEHINLYIPPIHTFMCGYMNIYLGIYIYICVWACMHVCTYRRIEEGEWPCTRAYVRSRYTRSHSQEETPGRFCYLCVSSRVRVSVYPIPIYLPLIEIELQLKDKREKNNARDLFQPIYPSLGSLPPPAPPPPPLFPFVPAAQANTPHAYTRMDSDVHIPACLPREVRR